MPLGAVAISLPSHENAKKPPAVAVSREEIDLERDRIERLTRSRRSDGVSRCIEHRVPSQSAPGGRGVPQPRRKVGELTAKLHRLFHRVRDRAGRERERRREVARRREPIHRARASGRRCRTAAGQDRDALVVPRQSRRGHAQYLPAALGREADVTAVHHLFAAPKSGRGMVTSTVAVPPAGTMTLAGLNVIAPPSAAPLVVADGVNVLPNVDRAA